MKVLFLIDVLEGNILHASYRYRWYQFLPGLELNGIEFSVQPATAILPQRKIFHRMTLLNQVLSSDVVVIQRHLYEEGTFRLLKAMNRPIIYDYDDALYSFPTGQSTAPPAKWLEIVRSRLQYTLRHSRHIIASCKALADYAGQFNSHVSIIPGFVTTNGTISPKLAEKSELVIGWIGRAENLIYLQSIAPALRALYGENPFILRVVCNQPLLIEGLPIDNQLWSRTNEETDVASFDISIIPLIDDEWSRGKFSLKTVQAMALGIPVVVSPIGGNAEIVKNGQNGLVARSQEEWRDQLRRLLTEPGLRMALGQAGRQTVLEQYSVDANLPKFLQILEAVVSNRARNQVELKPQS